MTVAVRPYEPHDREPTWRALEPVFRAGETYAIDPDISKEAALAYWTGGGRQVFSATDDDNRHFLGTYYLVRNQGGGGGHVCNCGFVTAEAARGRGVARTMLAHALDTARAQGFRAMQFNFVVSTNTRAIALWERAGFEIVGRLPEAFNHPEKGYVEALVMMKRLTMD